MKPDIYSYEDAIRMAHELELDLVEIVPTAEPPVCKIIEYQKFLYEIGRASCRERV